MAPPACETEAPGASLWSLMETLALGGKLSTATRYLVPYCGFFLGMHREFVRRFTYRYLCEGLARVVAPMHVPPGG